LVIRHGSLKIEKIEIERPQIGWNGKRRKILDWTQWLPVGPRLQILLAGNGAHRHWRLRLLYLATLGGQDILVETGMVRAHADLCKIGRVVLLESGPERYPTPEAPTAAARKV